MVDLIGFFNLLDSISLQFPLPSIHSHLQSSSLVKTPVLMRHTPGIPAIVSLFPCSSIGTLPHGFDIIFILDLPVKLVNHPII